MKRCIRLLACAPLMLVTIAGCGDKAGDDKAAAKDKRPDIPVTVVESQLRTLADYQRSVGTVVGEANPNIAAEVVGRVSAVLVQAGDKVARGQVLLRLDDRDQALQLESAKAEERRLQALIAQQQRTVERYETLGKDQLISREQLDESRSQRQVLDEQLAAARAQIAQSQHGRDKTVVRSPVAGRIQSRNVTVGDRINPDKVLFTLVSDQSMRVQLPFPELVASQIRPGLTVQLSSPGAPGRTLTAKVSDTQPGIDAVNRGFHALVDLPPGAGLMPGASVDARVITRVVAKAVMVPEIAVVLRPTGKVVYLVQGNKVQERVVQTGLQQDGWVEITAGLQGGERIAADGAAYLTNGIVVAIKPATAKESVK